MMMTKSHLSRLLLAGVLATVTLPVLPVAAQGGRRPDYRRAPVRRAAEATVRLGVKEIDGRRDSDSINVNARGRFRAIMLRVTDSPARIHSVVVHFENGKPFRAPVARTFGKGAFSQRIDLPGNSRDIDRVTFRYSDLRGGEDAEVALFGIR